MFTALNTYIKKQERHINYLCNLKSKLNMKSADKRPNREQENNELGL